MSKAPSPFVSVVIPSRNRAARLATAVESVRAQTSRDFEIVVVDDGSTDGTASLLRSLEGPSLRWHHNETAGGVSAARNLGARIATGEFLLFLDDDDRLEPDAVEVLRHQFEKDPSMDFAWGGRRVFTEDREGNVVSVREEIWTDRTTVASPALDFALRAATNCAFTVRRSVFLELSGFDETLRVSEDRELFIRLVHRGHAGAAAPQVLVDVAEHFRDSLSRNGSHGTRYDRQVVAKHAAFLAEPRFAGFLNQYRRHMFGAAIESGQYREAASLLGELTVNFGLHPWLLLFYWRNASWVRRLKQHLRYDSLRRFGSHLAARRRT